MQVVAPVKGKERVPSHSKVSVQVRTSGHSWVSEQVLVSVKGTAAGRVRASGRPSEPRRGRVRPRV